MHPKIIKLAYTKMVNNLGTNHLVTLRYIRDQKLYGTKPPPIIQAHKLIKQSRVPNFLNCRILVQTQLNQNRWRHFLADYWDKQFPDLIQYGVALSSLTTKHASALKYETHVEEHIREAFKHGVLYGPFDDLDLDIHTISIC